MELADSLDSGSSVHYGRAGSSPASRTKTKGHPFGCPFVLVSAVQRAAPPFGIAMLGGSTRKGYATSVRRQSRQRLCGEFRLRRGFANSACAEVLPAAKRSYGALAPPARKPVGWFFYPFSRFQNIDLDRSFQLVASVISLAPTFFISTSQPHTLGCDVCPPLCGGFFLSQGNIDFDRPFQMTAPRSIAGGLGLPASLPLMTALPAPFQNKS